VTQIIGTVDNDTLAGTVDDDILVGLQGDDTITGSQGSDQLAGNDGDDTLDGGDGNDKIWAGRGSDTISGGEGSDTADFHDDGMGLAATQGVVVDLAQGTATDGWGFTDILDALQGHVVAQAAHSLCGIDGEDVLRLDLPRRQVPPR
jgi:Ca2+-binding RTX toxin-like protein